MTDGSEWQGQVGQTWSREWRRTDRSFAGLTDRLLQVARGMQIERALDVGCGAGELSLALARSHPQAVIRGIDISEELVEVARERASNNNVKFAVMDAGEWDDASWKPDLIMSRHGVMFFDDPVRAFSHLRMAATPEARLVFSCFQRFDNNPWLTGLAGLLPDGAVEKPAPGYRPGPFAFADRDFVSDTLSEAGWKNIEFEPVDFAYIAGAGDDPVEDAVSYLLSIGPAAAAARALDHDERALFIAKLRSYLSSRVDGSIVALGAAAWIVTATA
ncbi:class I SAM-dependent methyltransferase [Altererythrobacter sp. ZODW24]|uniref:class I SAM-dependent methyltransferase n=1 Tax=Altererythrobacter sp. ZODW24 TaxID=2185142 RepID=UPI000DF80440|nr:class I SAM-dependent methyltransferase [Altererythrobacter sp. ZODW24]